jgi:Helix-turn-helix domain
MTKSTQETHVLAALKQGYRLTPLIALRRFGTLRLGARIYDLKRKGYKIESRLVKVGEAHVAEYWIDKPKIIK